MKERQPHDHEEDNTRRLMRLARAVFELARHTNDPRQLKLLCKIAAPLQTLLDEYEDDLQHPDLGLELNEYVRIKEYDKTDESGWIQMFGEATEARLNDIDGRIHFNRHL